MPKRRFDEARVLAAVAANDPPASADHLDVDEWHAAQDKWLVKWSGSVLFDGLLQYGCSVLGSAPMVTDVWCHRGDMERRAAGLR